MAKVTQLSANVTLAANTEETELFPRKLPQALSENVLTLLCLSDEYGKLVSETVKPHEFENQVHTTIAQRAIAFWKKHKAPPGKAHVADIVEEF